MKTRTQNLLIVLAVLAGIYQTNAMTIFSIATNVSVVEFGVGGACDGTNYLLAVQSGTNLSAQLISPSGTLIGLPTSVGKNPPFGAFGPGVAVGFGCTNYLVAWSDSSITSGVGIFGQFVASGGSKVGASFPLLGSVGTHGFQVIQAMAYDGTNFLVEWVDDSDRTIYIQFVTQAGSLLGSEIATTPGLGLPAGSAAMAFDGTNYLGVVQLAISSSPWQWGTYGRFFSRSGALGILFLISQTTSASYGPVSVTFDGTNYLVVWNRDIGLGYPDPQVWNVYGRLVSPAGTFPGNELALATNQAAMPFLAFDGSDYLLSWTYDLSTTNLIMTSSNVLFRFLDRSANPIGSEFTLFSPQGTNSPMFGGAFCSSNQVLAVATLGALGRSSSNGPVTGLVSGDVYGAFIPKSTAPPRLDVAGPLAGTQFPLLLTGTPGINYAIQMSTSLAPASWTAITTNSPSNGTFTFTDASATNKSRFYRAMKQ